jgi:hypothetical protein
MNKDMSVRMQQNTKARENEMDLQVKNFGQFGVPKSYCYRVLDDKEFEDYSLSAIRPTANRDTTDDQYIKFMRGHQLPFRISESNDLQHLLYLCQRAKSPTDVKLPLSSTVVTKINKLFHKYQEKIKIYLHRQKFISFTHNIWTSRQG